MNESTTINASRSSDVAIATCDVADMVRLVAKPIASIAFAICKHTADGSLVDDWAGVVNHLVNDSVDRAGCEQEHFRRALSWPEGSPLGVVHPHEVLPWATAIDGIAREAIGRLRDSVSLFEVIAKEVPEESVIAGVARTGARMVSETISLLEDESKVLQAAICSPGDGQSDQTLLSVADVESRLTWGGSYERLPMLLEMLPHLPRPVFFQALGNNWEGFDNIGHYRLPIAKLLRSASRAELDLMMNEKERAALAAMPEAITVYRGCYEINRYGLSWSTDVDVAARFPRLMRYMRIGEQPLLLRATAYRDRAVVKLGRIESEVIVVEALDVVEVPHAYA